jgi:nitric oxide reductase subunit C
MLSKSAARMFFLIGTGLCTTAFILLTVDTISRVPEQTKQQNLTPAVHRGKDLWDSSNCMGCHTLLGEGAYYAPELTKVYERRGPQFISSMLRDPAAMYPGQRQMQQYNFTEPEIADLVSFFQWIGEVDLNGFPPAPVLAATAAPLPPNAVSAAGQDAQPRVYRQMCSICHTVAGRGGNVGPILDGVADRRDAAYLARWLRDPAAVKRGTAMPKLPLSEEQITELTTYLSGLHARQGTP